MCFLAILSSRMLSTTTRTESRRFRSARLSARCGRAPPHLHTHAPMATADMRRPAAACASARRFNSQPATRLEDSISYELCVLRCTWHVVQQPGISSIPVELLKEEWRRKFECSPVGKC